jgi:hypothetical protein
VIFAGLSLNHSLRDILGDIASLFIASSKLIDVGITTCLPDLLLASMSALPKADIRR